MTPELQNTLARLAEKLGTTVGHLWPILVAKAKVDAGMSILWMGILGAALALVSWYSFKELRKDHDSFSDAPLGWGLLMGISGVAACVLLSCSVSNISNFIYPEAVVIQGLLGR